MFVQKASAVLKSVTEGTLSESADMLLDVLVHANRADDSYVGMISDFIVNTVHRRRPRKRTNIYIYIYDFMWVQCYNIILALLRCWQVIRDPNLLGLYASLCTDTVAKMSADPVLEAVCDTFRYEMKISCQSVLSELPRTSDATTAPQEYSVSKKVRVRTLDTCRYK